MWGMVFVEALLWSPFVFLLLAASFRSMDPSLEEASAVCGARAWQTFRRVSLQLMLPAFFSVLLLIFIRAFESFEIPALVGCRGIFAFSPLPFYSIRNGCRPPMAGPGRFPCF